MSTKKSRYAELMDYMKRAPTSIVDIASVSQLNTEDQVKWQTLWWTDSVKSAVLISITATGTGTYPS